MLPIINAINRGDIVEITRLCQRGYDVNARNSQGMTALMWAATRLAFALELEYITPILCEYGADINAQDVTGLTAIMHAVQWGLARGTQYLYEHGALLSIKSTQGKTVVDYMLDTISSADERERLPPWCITDLKRLRPKLTRALIFVLICASQDIPRLSRLGRVVGFARLPRELVRLLSQY